MRRIMLVVILAVSCSADRVPQDATSDGSGKQSPASSDAAPALANLTGLYEAGGPQAPGQLCMVEDKRGTQFALVAIGPGGHSCSGSGTVMREDGKLTFRMTGDSPCSFGAAIAGKSVTFASAVPVGCSYYCGARATLANVRWTQTGSSLEDARKAKDLVGGPLC